ncbi:hypothetical protein GCK72_022394 [Caenorhabditis remanei]|uniref:Uncharacterized protein n=1 Tax=Caenorhabditis remanei TaxID=31234 RepID=A0A6A5FTW8_CAERE|nr:hypothetical protein GCK72_022394 [Caenorhabditis remanei]KAF1745946.1 hypothetical protein GCK72_022394 [Caenorhabditis remanei]
MMECRLRYNKRRRAEVCHGAIVFSTAHMVRGGPPKHVPQTPINVPNAIHRLEQKKTSSQMAKFKLKCSKRVFVNSVRILSLWREKNEASGTQQRQRLHLCTKEALQTICYLCVGNYRFDAEIF